MTEFEYDEGGRLTRSTTTAEAEWDEQERAWMLALAEYEAGLCPNCGRPLAVCSAPGAEGKVQVPPPTRCHVTTAVAQAREPYAKAKHPNALMFRPSVAD